MIRAVTGVTEYSVIIAHIGSGESILGVGITGLGIATQMISAKRQYGS
jgi:hypothetical protein